MKKRIMSVAASLKIGGAEKVARDIGLYGDPDQYEHHYVVFGDEVGDYEQQIIDHGGKVFHLPSPGRNYAAYMRALCGLMRENGYHAVHAHTMFNCGWAMLAGKWMGVPIRVSHAHSALDDGDGFAKRIYEWVMRRLILCCATDLVACGEKAGIRLFGKKAYRKRGNLILNGVDTEKFRYNDERRNRIRGDLGWQNNFVIGHAGHLAEVKNQAFLLKLMPGILEQRGDAKLLLLGEGEDRGKLEQMIRELELQESVLMPGNVTNVEDYLCAMDVFVFPSLYEGMPLSILEVQSNGLPCVLSDGVPKDVFLTDLITPLTLTEDATKWIDTILRESRRNPERYADELQKCGFALSGAIEKIYRIYEG